MTPERVKELYALGERAARAHFVGDHFTGAYGAADRLGVADARERGVFTDGFLDVIKKREPIRCDAEGRIIAIGASPAPNLHDETVALARRFKSEADRLDAIFTQAAGPTSAVLEYGRCKGANLHRSFARKLFEIAGKMETGQCEPEPASTSTADQPSYDDLVSALEWIETHAQANFRLDLDHRAAEIVNHARATLDRARIAIPPKPDPVREAAPDLLAALRMVEVRASGLNAYEWGQIRAAIAKAESRTNSAEALDVRGRVRSLATEAEKEAARREYESDDIEIDDDALASRTYDGAWVQAWVWVSANEIAEG